jgi:hypothetical protein
MARATHGSILPRQDRAMSRARHIAIVIACNACGPAHASNNNRNNASLPRAGD